MPTNPAEPYPFELRPGCSALLIIDLQRDFLEPGGFGANLGNDVAMVRAIEPTRRVLTAALAASMPVIHTREGHRPPSRRSERSEARARAPPDADWRSRPNAPNSDPRTRS